jgi:hypothetical protein
MAVTVVMIVLRKECKCVRRKRGNAVFLSPLCRVRAAGRRKTFLSVDMAMRLRKKPI